MHKQTLLIKNARIVNEGTIFEGDVLIEDQIIKEIPIIFTDRRHGVSKLSKGIISEAILGVIKMRLKTILGTT